MSDEDMVEEDVNKLLLYFEVKDEQELYEKIMKESDTIPCICCRREFTIDELDFIDGDPYCLECLYA
jgi:hypothetical protein